MAKLDLQPIGDEGKSKLDLQPLDLQPVDEPARFTDRVTGLSTSHMFGGPEVAPRGTPAPETGSLADEFSATGEPQTDAFLKTVVNTIKGFGTGTASAFNQGFAGIAGVLASASDDISKATGLPKGGLFDAARKEFQQNSEYWNKKFQESAPDATAEFITKFVGGLAPGVVGWEAGVPFAAKEGWDAASKAGGNPYIGAAQSALERAITGGLFKAVAPLSRPARAAALGGTMTAKAALEGQPLAEAAGTGVGLGLMGGPGRGVDWRTKIDKIVERYREPSEEQKPVGKYGTIPGYEPSKIAKEIGKRVEGVEQEPIEANTLRVGDSFTKGGKKFTVDRVSEFDGSIKVKDEAGVTKSLMPDETTLVDKGSWLVGKAKVPLEEKAAEPALQAKQPEAPAEAVKAKPQEVVDKLAEDVRSSFERVQAEFPAGTPEREKARLGGEVDQVALGKYAYPLLSVDPANPVSSLEKSTGERFQDAQRRFNTLPLDRDMSEPEKAASLRLFDTVGPGLERLVPESKLPELRKWIDDRLEKPTVKEKKPIQNLRPAVTVEGVVNEGVEGGTHQEVISGKDLPEGARGFVTPTGESLNREQAKDWVAENQPEVAAKMPEGEFHSEPYADAAREVAEEKTGVRRTALDRMNDVAKELGVSPVEAKVKAEAEEVPTAGRTFIEPPAFKEAVVEKPVEEITKEMESIKGQMDSLRKELTSEEFEGAKEDVYGKLDRLEERYRLLNKSKDSAKTGVAVYFNPITEALKVAYRDIFRPSKDFWARPPQRTDATGIVGKYQGDVQRYSFKLKKLADSINKEFPKDEQRAMARYMEADGDEATLQDWRDRTKDPVLKKVYDQALNLSDNAKAMARQGRVVFDEGWKDAVDAGILDDEAWVENYFAHLGIEKPNAVTKAFRAEVNSGALRKDPFLAKKRLFNSLFELEQAGFKQKKDADTFGYGIVAWHQALAEAKAAREAIKAMSSANMPDGNPMVYIGGGGHTLTAEDAAKTPEAILVRPNMKNAEATEIGYKPFNHPALRKWKWIDSSSGTPILIEGQMLIHPKAEAQMKAMLGKSWFQTYTLPEDIPFVGGTRPFVGAKRASAFIKGTILSGGILPAPFHQIAVAEHALFHGVNPTRVPELDLEKPVVRELVDHGLMLFNHNALSEYGEGTSSGGLGQWLGNKLKEYGEEKLPKDSKIRKVTDKADYMQRYGEYLFQDYIPRLKSAMAEAAVQRAERWYAEDLRSGKITRDQLLDNVAKQANAAFGEINYKYIGRNPTYQDGLKLLLLAPDFLEARLKFAGQALRPYGREQQLAFLKGAVMTALATQALNTMFGDEHRPNWKKPFTVTVDKKDYSPRSVIADVWHGVTDPRNFALYRLNPAYGRPAYEVITGRDIKGKALTGDEVVADIAKSWTPITTQELMKYSPEDSKALKLLDGIMQSFGITGYRSLTDAEKLLYDMRKQDRPEGGYTKEQKKKMDMMQRLRAQYKSGKISDVGEAYDVAEKGGVALTRDDLKDIEASKLEGEEAETRDMERLMKRRSVHELMKVFRVMSPEEKSKYKDYIIGKMSKSKSLTVGEKEKYYDELEPPEETKPVPIGAGT